MLDERPKGVGQTAYGKFDQQLKGGERVGTEAKHFQDEMHNRGKCCKVIIDSGSCERSIQGLTASHGSRKVVKSR